MRKRGFFFGDIHFPFHHKLYLPAAIWFCIHFKPDYIVQKGDLRDWYSSSRFTRKVNLFTPKQEDEWASYYSEIFWSLLNEYVPKCEKYQLLGNHCVRPVARIMEKAPEFEEDLIEILHEKYTFEGVKTIFDPREELDIDDQRFVHGYLSQLGSHARFNQMSMNVGHSHQGGVVYIPLKEKIIWELNSGYLADPMHPALGYTMQKKATRWTHGFGCVDENGPRFVALTQWHLDSLREDKLFKKLLHFGPIKL